MKKFALILSLFASHAFASENQIAGAASSTSAKTRPLMLDVNDVSILAGGSSDHPIPNILLSDFMGAEVFDDLMQIALTEQVKEGPVREEDVKSMKNWRILGVRFDPCAPSPFLAFNEVPEVMRPSVPGCIVQIRLTSSPAMKADTFQDGDINLHLIFDLGVAPPSKSDNDLNKNFSSFLPLIEGLQNIKKTALEAGISTDGQLLGIHPAFAKGAKENRVAQELLSYLRKFAKPETLSHVAFHSAAGPLGQTWHFLSGDTERAADGKLHFILKNNPAFHQSEVKLSTFDHLGNINPPSEFPERSLNETLFLKFVFGPSRPSGAEPHTATTEERNAIVEVDHPFRTHIFNTDCVSCHVSTMAWPAQNIKASDHPDRYLIPKGISGYVSTDIPKEVGPYSVPSFGRTGRNTQVHSRTITETAAVADLTNRIIAGENAQNPGLDCGENRKELDELWDCTMLNLRILKSKRRSCVDACKVVGQPK